MKKKKILYSQVTGALRDGFRQLAGNIFLQNSEHQNPGMYFQKKMSVMKSSGMLPVGFFSACGSEERGSLA